MTVLAQHNDDRAEFYGRLRDRDLSPLWEVLSQLVPPEPRSQATAARWRWPEVRSLLLESGNRITAEEAERRVLILENPGLARSHRVTSTLYAGIQLVLPGEIAPCHRHTQSALRFVLEGKGAFTAVDGEPVHMGRWDLVLTPAMRWHDHGNETSEPIAWLDGLDIPIVAAFDAGFAEKFGDHKAHPRSRPSGDSVARFGANLRPARRPETDEGGLFSYRHDQWRTALEQVAKGTAPDPHDAFRLEFVNPCTGDSVSPTLSAFAQLIPGGFSAKPVRSTDGQVIVATEGAGCVTVGDTRYDLREGDIVVAPAWLPRVFAASSDLVLFSFSDRAAQTRLGLWREVLS